MAKEFILSAGNVTASTTLIWLNNTSAPNIAIEVLRWWVGQSANATSAQQRVDVFTQVTGFPVMTATTPRHLKFADTVASILVGSTTGNTATCGTQATTEGGGATTIALNDAFNVLNGWLQVPTPPETFVVPAGFLSGIGLQLAAIPASQASWSYGCTYREV
jgi:hypothetical protein